MSRPAGRTHLRLLSLDAVYLAAAAAITAIVPLLSRVAPHDFWWHLAYGRMIVREGRVPTMDAFSFTHPGEPFFDQSWLAQVCMYALHQVGGLPLLIVVQAALMLGACAGLLWVAVRQTGRLRLAVAVLLLAIEPNAYSNWSIRPQSYVIPIFVAYLVVLTGYRQRWWRTLWPLAPLMALWVNLHGTFVLGLAMIALMLIGEGVRRRAGDAEALPATDLRRLALHGAAAAAAVFLNPRGPLVYGYVANLLRAKSVSAVVTEWASPTPKDANGVLFFGLVVVLFVALIYARRRPALTDLLLVLPFLWLALSAGRNILWFALVAYLPLTTAMAPRRDEEAGPDAKGDEQGVPAANATLIVMLAAGVVLALPWLRSSLGLPAPMTSLTSSDTPIAAVEVLRGLPAGRRPGRLFHSTGFGSYLMWALPEQRVFADPRFEFYPMSQFTDYVHLSAGCNVERLLDRYRIDGLLLERKSQEELVKAVRSTRGWRVLYEDASAVLMVPTRSGEG